MPGSLTSWIGGFMKARVVVKKKREKSTDVEMREGRGEGVG